MDARAIVKQTGLRLQHLISDADVEYILWEQTGFPRFWDIPTDGKTPEECLRKQVETFLSSLSSSVLTTSVQE